MFFENIFRILWSTKFELRGMVEIEWEWKQVCVYIWTVGWIQEWSDGHFMVFFEWRTSEAFLFYHFFVLVGNKSLWAFWNLVGMGKNIILWISGLDCWGELNRQRYLQTPRRQDPCAFLDFSTKIDCLSIL